MPIVPFKNRTSGMIVVVTTMTPEATLRMQSRRIKLRGAVRKRGHGTCSGAAPFLIGLDFEALPSQQARNQHVRNGAQNSANSASERFESKPPRAGLNGTYVLVVKMVRIVTSVALAKAVVWSRIPQAKEKPS